MDLCLFNASGLEKESALELPELTFVQNVSAGGFRLLERGHEEAV